MHWRLFWVQISRCPHALSVHLQSSWPEAAQSLLTPGRERSVSLSHRGPVAGRQVHRVSVFALLGAHRRIALGAASATGGPGATPGQGR